LIKQAAICIIDGDTFDTDRNVQIRLARVKVPPVNTPEGQKAKGVLESLILRKAITYEPEGTDTYGRTVAEVWVDSVNVNDIMISYGYK